MQICKHGNEVNNSNIKSPAIKKTIGSKGMKMATQTYGKPAIPTPKKNVDSVPAQMR